jgi:hypothetical protein
MPKRVKPEYEAAVKGFRKPYMQAYIVKEVNETKKTNNRVGEFCSLLFSGDIGCAMTDGLPGII